MGFFGDVWIKEEQIIGALSLRNLHNEITKSYYYSEIRA